MTNTSTRDVQTVDVPRRAGRTDRANLLLQVWRPRDWARMQRHRDMRIVMRSLRELKRKNAEPALVAAADGRQSP